MWILHAMFFGVGGGGPEEPARERRGIAHLLWGRGADASQRRVRAGPGASLHGVAAAVVVGARGVSRRTRAGLGGVIPPWLRCGCSGC